MRYFLGSLLLVCSAGLCNPVVRGDEAKKDSAPLFCEKGKMILMEDFASPALPKDWRVAKGKWEMKDGAVRGDELASDKHAAVLRHDLATHNLLAEFSFRFDGGKQMAFSINNKGGHVCRAKITPSQLQVAKDRPNDKSPEKGVVLDTQKLNFAPGEWHTAVIEIAGKTIVASIDGKTVAFGSNDGIDVDKTSVAFPVAGEGVSIKAVHIFDATAPADPAAALKKLEALHSKTASAK